MAKKKQEIKVEAKVYLKYDKTPIAKGEEFKARVEDAKAMQDKGYVELLEELPKENAETSNVNTEASGEDDNSREGE